MREFDRDRFSDLIRKSGKTYQEIASELGVTRQLVGFWAAKKNPPTLARIGYIADYFGVSVDYFFPPRKYRLTGS